MYTSHIIFVLKRMKKYVTVIVQGSFTLANITTLSLAKMPSTKYYAVFVRDT